MHIERSSAVVVAVAEAFVVVVLGVESFAGLALADLLVQGKDCLWVAEFLLPLLEDRFVLGKKTDAGRSELLQSLFGDFRVFGAELRDVSELLLAFF